MSDKNLSKQLDHIAELLKWLPTEICNVLDERDDVRNEKIFQNLNEEMKKFTMGFSYKPTKTME